MLTYALGRGLEYYDQLRRRRDRRGAGRRTTTSSPAWCSRSSRATRSRSGRRDGRRADEPSRGDLAADGAAGPGHGRSPCPGWRRWRRAAGWRPPPARARAPTRMAFLYVPNGVHMADWTPEGRGRRLRRCRRSSSRSAPFKDDLLVLTGLTQRQGRGPRRRRRRPRPALASVPDRRPAAQDRRRRHPGRRLGRPGRRPADRRADAASPRWSSAATAARRPATATPATAAPTRRTSPGARERRRWPRRSTPGWSSSGCSPAHARASRPPRARRELLPARASSTSSLEDASGLQAPARRHRPPQARRVPDRASARSSSGSPAPRQPPPVEPPRRRQARRASPSDYRRAHPPDGRPDGAGLPDRRDPDQHVHVRQRGEQPELPVHRRPRGPPRPLAPRQRPEEAREDHARSTASTSSSSPTCSSKLKAITEGDGTLLDNCMIVYGSGISDGNRHNHDDLPILARRQGRRHDQDRPAHPLRPRTRR